MSLCAPAQAASTYYVSTTGTDAATGSAATPFKTIGRGNSACQTGDTVIVGDGIYSGIGNTHLTISSTITLQSANGPTRTTIDCTGANGALTIATGSTLAPVVVTGFTFQHNPGSLSAVTLTGATASITNCTFLKNTSGVNGGAITTDDNSSLTVTGSKFSLNRGPSGGAIYGLGSMTCQSCRFVDNQAIQGAATFTASPTKLTNCTFDGNQSDGDGGAVMSFNGLTVDSCTFTNNTAEAHVGGALCLVTGDATIVRSTVSNNHALAGAGIDLNAAMLTTLIQNCILTGNVASDSGGAIFVDQGMGGTASICGSTIRGNSAVNNGGGITVKTQAGVNVKLRDDIFWDDGAELDDASGAIDVQSCDVASLFALSNLSIDPVFTDAAAGDYSLHSGSPCLHAGTGITGMTTDFAGQSRSGTKPTIGAFEGGPGSNWKFVANVAGADGIQRYLWAGMSGASDDIAIWRIVPPATNAQSSKEYGPFPGWKPLFIGIGPNLHERILYFNANTAKFWLWDVSPNYTYTTLTIGPSTGYIPTSMTVSSDNHVHMVCVNSSGAAYDFDIAVNGSFTSKGYGPY